MLPNLFAFVLFLVSSHVLDTVWRGSQALEVLEVAVGSMSERYKH
jgi:hypothetical protein